jgi:hypothetical protein
LVGSPLIWLSGAQQDILARCAADRPKYAGMGSAILITATMAGISMTFALHSVLKLSLPTAIPFAVAWSLAIMSLDRWLVVSLVRQRNKLNYLLLALPRVALGLLFGLIISTPFTLQIFQPEINQQIQPIQQQNLDDFLQKQKAGQLAKMITDDQARVSNDNEIITSLGRRGSQDQTLNGLKQTLDQDRSRVYRDYQTWNCQLNGCPGFHAGDGPAAKAAHDTYETDKKAVIKDQVDIANHEHGLQKSANARLAGARKDLGPAQGQLNHDKAMKDKKLKAFTSANASNAGLLLRMQALDEVAASSSTLQAARWLLFLFFTSIECLPILVKVLLNLGPETCYEKALAHAEQAGLQLAKQEITLAADALGDETGRLHAEWRANALPEVIHDATAARDRVARSRLASWERRETASVDGGGPIGPGGLSGVGTGWAAARMSRWPASSAVKSRLRAAQRARRPAKTPQQPTRPSAWPYWPDSL